MKRWWLGLESRERYMMTVAAIVVTAALLYAVVWKPLQMAIMRSSKQIVQMQSQLVWMRHASSLLETESHITMTHAPALHGSLLNVVDQVAQAQGIGKDNMELSENSDDKLHVKMQRIALSVSFVGWMS